MLVEVVPLQTHLQERLDEAMHEIVGSLCIAYIGKTVSRKDDPSYRIVVDDVTMDVYVDKLLHTTQKITFWENDKKQSQRTIVVGELADLANINDHGRGENPKGRTRNSS
jgi:hypothetical protein